MSNATTPTDPLPVPGLPLTGIRVLDLSNVLAGPFCGYHLARLGAEVIKIENPRGGDLARRLGADPAAAARGMGLSFLAVNAGKQSVAIDLKAPRGRALFLKLVEKADVVLENFRPQVMTRLGLDYPVLAAVNPRLVYCAISGFGQSGPWAERPAYDQIVQGLSGAMSVTGDARTAPLRTGYPVCDTIAGMTAAFAITAALLDQQRSGRGRQIDVSLLESTLAAMGWVVSNHLNGGITPQPMGNENFSAAPSGLFRTGAGPLNIAANEQRQFEALCRIINRPELIADPRFADRHARTTHRGALTAAIEEALATRSAVEWERIFTEAGVPAGQVLSVPEALRSAQLAGRDFVETLADSPVKVTRPGFRFAEAFPRPSPPPQLGQETTQWLISLGLPAEEIADLAAAGIIAMPRAP